MEFKDPDHDLRIRRKIHSLKQTASVNSYIATFRMLLMELGKNSLTDGEAMFMFIEGLKPAVRHQVYVNRPSTLADAELDAERIDSALYLSKGKGDGSGPVPMDLGMQLGDY